MLTISKSYLVQSKEIYCKQNRIFIFFSCVFILGLLICNGSAIDSEIIYWKIVQGKYPNDEDEEMRSMMMMNL